jgi:glucuronoarabinoxylan endo-1,4-beta-xylanase
MKILSLSSDFQLKQIPMCSFIFNFRQLIYISVKSNRIRLVLIFFMVVQMFYTHTALAQEVIQVYKGNTKQTIWGFGGAANHPVQDLKTKLSEANQKIVLDKLFRTDEDNAGLSIVRLEINGFRKTDTDPNNRLQYTFEPEDGVWDWETDQYQRWFALEAKNRSQGVHFMSCPWSPPGWMKSNNSPINGGSIGSAYYDKFATYMKTYVDHYRNIFGIDIRWISIQNEPNNSTAYASCKYTNSDMDIIAGKVADAVHGLNQGVLVGAPEGATRAFSLGFMNGMSATTKSKLDFIPTHDYTGASSILAGFGKPVMNTEVWSEAGSDDITITDGLRWANAIKDALVLRNEVGWLYWWILDANSGAQGIVVIKSDGSYVLPKRLFTIGQFSRFMRKGDVRVEATSSNSNLAVVATKDSLNKTSLLVINNSSIAIDASIKGFSTNNLEVYRTSASENLKKLTNITASNFVATLSFPAKSITTLVETAFCINAAPTITAPENQTYVAGTGTKHVKITGISDGDSCTQGVSITAISSKISIATIDSIEYTACLDSCKVHIIPVAQGSTVITLNISDKGTSNCGPSSTTVNFKVTVTQSNNVSVSSDKLVSNVLIYPNPANDYLTIEMNQMDYTTLTLVDMSGRIIQSLPIDNKQTKCKLNLAGIENGVYILKLSKSNGEIVKKSVSVVKHI